MKLILEKRERVIVKTRAHRRVLRGPFLRFLLLLAGGCYALGLLLRTDLPPWVDEGRPLLAALLAVVFGVLLVIWCLRPWIRWANSYIYLTTERIVTRRGRRAAGQHSIGLYAIHDIVAVVRPNAPETAPGTLSVVLAEQRFNIPHVPAVARMRDYCIGAITALPNFPRVDGVNMEERVDGDPPPRPTNDPHQQHPEQQQREWTEHE
ncbi:hypothetical protein ACIPVK_05885 [Paeniglutamicibacter sp. MACA_103]|uniref:hypothetical protein n=1 Tax=Paeniglutamicibacter sp. MACA_103 TaxID=3377337 RepID=UPI0038933882